MIDLGVPGTGPGSRRRTRGAGWRAVRGWWAHRRRRVRAGVTGALAVLLLSGSAAASGHPVSVPLPPGGDGRFEVVGDLLFVAESRTRWGVHELATGQRRWSLQRAGRSPVGLTTNGGVLVDQQYGLGRGFDPVSGAVRWTGPHNRGGSSSWSTFESAPGTGAGVVAGYHWSTPNGLAHRLTGIDVATGATRWEVLPPDPVQVQLAGDPPRVVTVAADGRVRLRALASGEVLASRRLPELAGRARVPGGVQVVLVAGRLVLASADPDGLVLRGYAAGTLAAAWELAVPDRPDRPRRRTVGRCGPMVCAGQPDLVVDPATGRVAWTAPAGRWPLRAVGDRFLAFDHRGELRALLDARTGRRLRDLSGWRPALPAAGTGADRLLLTRPAPDAGTRVAWLDPASLALSDLGLLPGRPELCRPYPGGLVCRHHDRLWVWPLPLAAAT